MGCALRLGDPRALRDRREGRSSGRMTGGAQRVVKGV